jgi:hypothetical protein
MGRFINPFTRNMKGRPAGLTLAHLRNTHDADLEPADGYILAWQAKIRGDAKPRSVSR